MTKIEKETSKLMNVSRFVAHIRLNKGEKSSHSVVVAKAKEVMSGKLDAKEFGGQPHKIGVEGDIYIEPID